MVWLAKGVGRLLFDMIPNVLANIGEVERAQDLLDNRWVQAMIGLLREAVNNM